MKQQTCKQCGSIYHTKMYHNPKKPIKRSVIKPQIRKVTKVQKAKAKTRSYYVKQLDDVFSKYIRQKYAIDGLTACVTCGVVKRWQELQNGHYESRGKLPTRWSEDNCHPQCVGCNVFKKGNYTEYSIWMIQTYGADKLTELKARANSREKIATSAIKDMIEIYSQKVLT